VALSFGSGRIIEDEWCFSEIEERVGLGNLGVSGGMRWEFCGRRGVI
jgi:hypothetical protein